LAFDCSGSVRCSLSSIFFNSSHTSLLLRSRSLRTGITVSSFLFKRGYLRLPLNSFANHTISFVLKEGHFRSGVTPFGFLVQSPLARFFNVHWRHLCFFSSPGWTILIHASPQDVTIFCSSDISSEYGALVADLLAILFSSPLLSFVFLVFSS